MVQDSHLVVKHRHSTQERVDNLGVIVMMILDKSLYAVTAGHEIG